MSVKHKTNKNIFTSQITVLLNYVGIGKTAPVVNMFLSKMQNKRKSFKCFLLTEQPLKIMTVVGYTM